MTVAICSRCQKLISISLIPGGNPLAASDADNWAATYRQCDTCGQLFCDECGDMTPLCPECPGPRKPVSRQAQIAHIRQMCRKANDYTGGEIVDQLWGFTTPNQTLEDKIKALQDAFTPSEMQSLSDAASRFLSSAGEFLSISWRGGYCWHPNTEAEIPFEFIQQLAKSKS
jgi:hypothetical protein